MRFFCFINLHKAEQKINFWIFRAFSYFNFNDELFNTSYMFQTSNSKSIPKIKLSGISQTRLDLECSSPASNKHTICKILHKLERISTIFSCTWFVHLVFSQCLCLLNSGIEHSRSDLIFKQRNNYFRNALFVIASS